MTETLVLGNGISRLSYDAEIRSWPGEVWGCNRAYLEYGEKLSRLTGHTNVLFEAAEYLREHPACTFRIWAGHLGGAALGFADRFDCPARFCRDSGSTMVAQALHEGRQVAVAGFDLGGWDIHSPGLESHDKTNWVTRWRQLFEEYGHDRVRFIGFDHLPYLLSNESAKAYRDRYMAGNPHIADAEYLRTWEQFTGQRAVVPLGRIGAMARVRFPNGYEADMRESLALRMAGKGDCEIVKAEKPKAEPKPEPKAEEPKRARTVRVKESADA